MREIGLSNVALEPFMDYGTRWDNEYTSLHMLEPDYQPMVGYPISHTPGTDGKKTVRVVNADDAEVMARTDGFGGQVRRFSLTDATGSGADLVTDVSTDSAGHEQFFAADDPATGLQLGFISRTGHRVGVGTANVLALFDTLDAAP